MRVKKKMIVFAATCLCAALVMCLSSCAGIGGKYDEKTIQGVITDIAPDDLGRAVVFADIGDGEKMMFVKNFYSEGKSYKKAHEDSDSFVRTYGRYRGRRASIRYYQDDIGDNVIVEIK